MDGFSEANPLGRVSEPKPIENKCTFLRGGFPLLRFLLTPKGNEGWGLRGRHSPYFKDAPKAYLIKLILIMDIF